MGEYEPRDSRNVTQKQQPAPGEPPRTGPREGDTRRPRQQGRTELEQRELYEDGRGEEAEATIGQADAEAEAELRERSMERDADELDAGESRARPGDRND